MTTASERWRKARASAQTDNCIELSSLGAVRDSKNPNGPSLRGVDRPGLLAAAKAWPPISGLS
jgi:Domain of unknown function (DUF397)